MKIPLDYMAHHTPSHPCRCQNSTSESHAACRCPHPSIISTSESRCVGELVAESLPVVRSYSHVVETWMIREARLQVISLRSYTDTLHICGCVTGAERRASSFRARWTTCSRRGHFCYITRIRRRRVHRNRAIVLWRMVVIIWFCSKSTQLKSAWG